MRETSAATSIESRCSKMRCSSVRASQRRRCELLLAALCTATPVLGAPGRVESGVDPAPQHDAPVGAIVKVTWPDLVQMVERHPRLAAGKLQVEAARGGVAASRALPNPTLEGNIGQGLARSGGASRLEWGLAVTMPLGWLAQRGASVDAARAEVDAAAAEVEALRRDVLLQLRTLFWHLVDVQDRVASIEALEAQTSALVDTVGRRVAQGEARPVEATRVEIEFHKVGSELTAARTELGARQAALALWLGVPAGKVLVATVDSDRLVPTLDRDTALARARATHPAVTAARARARVLDAELASANLARFPAFSITGFTSYELDRRAYGVGLAVDVPLWNWNEGPVMQAEARRAAGEKLTEAASLELETAVLEAQSACEAAATAAARFRHDVLPRSVAAATTMEKTYQLGETSLLEVIDARRTLLDARRLYSSSLAQAQIDCSRLDVLVGEVPQ